MNDIQKTFPQPVSGTVTPRFGDIATFMRLPLFRDPADVEIGMVGVPWDGGRTNRPGARHGPRQMRDLSTMMRRIHHVTRVAPYELAKCGVQMGIRGSLYRRDDNDWAVEQGMRVITIEEYFDLGVEKVIAEARRVVGDGPTYVSFDVDGLDPAYAPGTGTPEIGGYTPHEAQRMLRGLRGLNLVGGDVVEVSPPFDMSGNTPLVRVTLMWEILCLPAESVAHRKGRI